MDNKDWIAEFTDTDSEVWNIDIEADTRAEIIKKGIKYAALNGYKTFRIGRAIDFTPSINADNVVESVKYDAYELAGEVTSDFLNCLSKNQLSELSVELNKVFNNWAEKHDLIPEFFYIKDDEWINVEDEFWKDSI